MKRRSRLQNRVELLGTGAALAFTIALAHGGESFAQAIPALQGRPTVVSGDVFINRGGPSGGSAAVDTISLNSSTAIINWDTFVQETTSPIDFLPQNTVARFVSFNQNFTVLNRVLSGQTGQPISINGTVLAQNFNNQTTGNVWFYSPTGIIAGPTAVFNVGNLILTADDIDTTNGLFGANNTIRFRGAAGSTASVNVQAGARINLNNAGSYLALVAPQVTMNGTATINGSAAYIAAEQVDVRINSGAFDIAFIAGTGVANALIHSGTTTGPGTANGTIAMAAMPKNTAITMLVGGTVGYTPAASATVQNGAVVLSAGQNLVGGTINPVSSTTAANLTIGSGSFTSQVTAQGRKILASPNGGGALNFSGNVTLIGLDSIELRSSATEAFAVGGDLSAFTALGTIDVAGGIGAGRDLFLSGTVVTGTGALTAGRDTAVSPTGNATLASVTAGRNAYFHASPTASTVTVGPVSAGGFVEARGAALNFGNVTAGTDAILSSFNGGLTVGNVTAGDDVFLTVNGSAANPNTISPDSQTGQGGTTAFALVAGNVRSTGQGSDPAASGPLTFASGTAGIGGPGPTGNVIRVRSSGTVTTGTIDTAGTAIVASDQATVATQAITGPAGVAVFVRGNATVGNVTTNGVFWLGDSSQYFAVVPNYTVDNFAPFQTPTSGSASLGAVSAGLIRGSVRDATTFGSLASTGDTLWTTGTGSVIGGSITGGSLATGQSLTLRAGGSIGFTTATAGTSATLSASTGNLVGTSIVAQNINAGSRTGLTLTSANGTGGSVSLSTLSNVLRADTVQASGEIIIAATDGGSSSANVVLGTVTSGGNTRIQAGTTAAASSIAATTITTGGYLETRGGSLNFGDVTSGTDAILSAYSGALTAGNVTAGDDIWINNFSTTASALTTQNLRSTGLGSDTALSGQSTFPDSAGPTGNVVLVRSIGAVQTGTIATPDRIIVVSDQARATTGNLTAPGGIAALARTGVGLGAVDTNGLFIVRSADQFPLLTTNYQIASLNSGTVGGTAVFQTLGPVNLTTVRAASVQVNADAAIGFSNITTTGAVDLANAYTQGNNVTGGSIAAGGVVGILSSGNVGFATITTPGNASIAGSGAITGTSLTASTFSVSGQTGVTVATAIATAPASSPGFSTLQATNGAVNVANLQSLTPVSAFGRSIFIRGPGALNFNQLQGTATTIDVATTGNLTVDQARALGDITLTSQADLSVNNLDAGYNFAQQTSGFQAAATLTGANVNIRGLATTGRTLTINATNAATIAGTARGRFETLVNSADIVIASGGVLGGTGNAVTLTNTGTGRTFIGDVDGTGGWRLDATELGRITANSIFIVAPVIGGPASFGFNSSRTPDVTVGTFTARVGQQIGGEGTFSISTGGKVRVTGAANFENMGSDATVSIRGDEAVEILDAGRIVLNGPNGLAGSLRLSSRNIVASSTAALADFAAATDLKAISDRAAKNDGAVNEGGYLQAGSIRAELLSSTIIIQNTGAATTVANTDYAGRRGFTVGTGGFTIVKSGETVVRVAINGRQAGESTGTGTPTFVTGLDLSPMIKFTVSNETFSFPASGATAAQQQQALNAFDPLSTVNGCAIIGIASCRAPTPNRPPVVGDQEQTLNDPTRDIIEEDFGEGSVANLLPQSIIQLKDYGTSSDDPLIDEPVTGAANDDLWSVDDSTKCDPAKEVCK